MGEDTRPDGYDTVFGLKFPYDQTSFPAPGTAELDRLERLTAAMTASPWLDRLDDPPAGASIIASVLLVLSA